MGQVIPMQDLTISGNPSWGVPSAAGLLLLWLYLLGWGGWWTHHQGGGCGFWLPYTTGHHECTSGLSPKASAVASFLRSWGICRLQCLGKCDFDPVRGQGIIQDLSVGEHGERFHGSPELQHAHCQLVRLARWWQLGFLHPILKGLGIGQGLLGLLHVVVLSTKLHIWKR